MKMLDFFKKIGFEVWAIIFTAFTSISLYFIGALKYGSDDQFIILRYIDNIASGNGFVYNIGEKILGSTTPLFTLLGALLKSVFFFADTQLLIVWFNIVLLSTAAFFFYKVARNFLSERFSFLTVVVFALSLSKVIPEGMETSLFILLLFVFLHYLFLGKNYISAVVLSLLVLTRPDAGLVALLTFVYWWKNFGFKDSVRFSSVSILVALPWFIFAMFYFGSIIPQSIATKTNLHNIVNIESYHALKVQMAGMSKTYWGKIFDPDNIPLQIIFNLIPFIFFVYLGFKNKINSKNWILWGIPFTYFITYSIQNPLMWSWYVSQKEPLWILISMIGVSVLFEKIKKDFLKGFLFVLILSGPVFFWLSGVVNDDPGNKINSIPIAEYIRKNMTEGDTVGVNNIGVLGFYLNDVKIIDFFGLVNDYASEFYPVNGECTDKSLLYNIPPNLVMFTEPDWVILSGKGELEECFIRGDWFSKRYQKESIEVEGALLYKKIK